MSEDLEEFHEWWRNFNTVGSYSNYEEFAWLAACEYKNKEIKELTSLPKEYSFILMREDRNYLLERNDELTDTLRTMEQRIRDNIPKELKD
jgi:hypothetical protein